METLYIKKKGEPEISVTGNHEFAFLNLVRGTPQPKSNLYAPTGLDGQIQQGDITFDLNTIQADFLINSNNLQELSLLEHKIYDIFSSRSSIRLRTSTEPAIVVNCYPQPFTLTRTDYAARQFSVNFQNLTGFRQSIVKSDEVFKFDGKRQIGLHLPTDKDYSYHFYNNDFDIYNPSDISIDPLRQRHDLTITIKGSSTDQIILTNTTTDEKFTYKKPLNEGETLILNGIDPYLNSNHCGKDTDHGTISLNKGINTFNISGIDNPDITFSFPFLYF